MTAPSSAEELGVHLTALRERLPKKDRSFDRMTSELYRVSNGTVWVSGQTLANYHAGKTPPERIDVAVLYHLAVSIYQADIEDLGPVGAERVRDLFQKATPLRNRGSDKALAKSKHTRRAA